MKAINDLQEGDLVIVISNNCKLLTKVDRVTKSQIIINNVRFRRDNGCRCGDKWCIQRIVVPTEMEIEEIRRDKLIAAIKTYDFDSLPTPKLKKALKMLDELRAD